MKLDLSVLRYMSKDEFRVLTAVEMGMKNHDVVPTTLIQRIAGLKTGGAFKMIKQLHKNKLIYHDAKKYDGYRLTYSGYDHLAVKAMVSRGHISAVGRKIGVGKESDIYEVYDEDGKAMVLKVHRLGRTSFRSIKNNRDYMEHRKSASWLYMSRLAAIREYAYMKALYDHGFPTPTPIDHNRHCVLMSLCSGVPFTQIRQLRHPDDVYSKLMNMIVRLAEHGLIHCDFNEFNLMIDEDETITMIDFPQMVSTAHKNAEMYFDRDVQCIRTYFTKKFKYEAAEYPRFFLDTERQVDLDVQLKASGVTKEDNERFESFVHSAPSTDEKYDSDDDDEESGDSEDGSSESDDESDSDESEEEEQEESANASGGPSSGAAEALHLAQLPGTSADTPQTDASEVLHLAQLPGAPAEIKEDSQGQTAAGTPTAVLPNVGALQKKMAKRYRHKGRRALDRTRNTMKNREQRKLREKIKESV